MASQTHRSLRVYKELTPPAAFDETDVNSHVSFTDWAVDSIDQFSGTTRDPQNAKCQGVMVAASGADVQWSFDGLDIHGAVKPGDGVLTFLGVREKEIYFQSSGGSVRLWAW